MKKLLLVLCASMALSGCSYVDRFFEKGNTYMPWHERTPSQDAIDEDYFKSRLLETAEMVSRSLRELAEMEQALRLKRHMEMARSSDSVKDPRLLQMVTISSLSGTELNIESIVDRLATVAEYDLKIMNKRPLVPVTVSVPKGQYRLIDLLENVGLQAGNNATIFVEDGVIKLVYSNKY